MKEQWRSVPGYPGYDVSTLGRVRSWKPRRYCAPKPSAPRILRGWINPKSGYRMLTLGGYDGTKVWNTSISKIVLLAWRGPKPTKTMVARHLNDKKLDDRLTNLRWGTQQQNIDDKVRNGNQTRGSDIAGSKLTLQKVRRILNSDLSMRALAAKHDVAIPTIWCIKTRRTWKHVKR